MRKTANGVAAFETFNYTLFPLTCDLISLKQSCQILRIALIERAPARFIQVNDGKRFDPIKTRTLTGTFKIWIAAGVNPGLSSLNYPFKGDKK